MQAAGSYTGTYKRIKTGAGEENTVFNSKGKQQSKLPPQNIQLLSPTICLTDLTGLLKTNFDKAIDHIVPLNLGGNNDITNLQLVCEKCNLEKPGHTIRTSDHYPTYF